MAKILEFIFEVNDHQLQELLERQLFTLDVLDYNSGKISKTTDVQQEVIEELDKHIANTVPHFTGYVYILVGKKKESCSNIPQVNEAILDKVVLGKIALNDQWYDVMGLLVELFD